MSRVIGFIDLNSLPNDLKIAELNELFAKLGCSWRGLMKGDLSLLVLRAIEV